MDYEELLKKYMQHVGDCEGAVFADRLNAGCGADVDFSDEEVAELERIRDELFQ